MSLPAALKRFPYHFLLLLLFFLLHGYSEYVGLIPFAHLFIFLIIGAGWGVLVFYIFKRWLRSSRKAGILTTLVLLFYLFYGSFKDLVHDGVRHSVLLPLMLVIVIATAYYLKKSTQEFSRLTLFINLLLLIYLAMDVVSIAVTQTKETARVAKINYTVCDTCAKPDIYLIVLDEYSGSNELQRYFNYNNQPFENALRQKGFFVAQHPSSNYSATAVSVASIFSMDYLPAFHRAITVEDYTRAEKAVNKSVVMQLLQKQGYQFLNHSILNLGGQPGKFTTDLLPRQLQLITHKTLWNRLNADLAWDIHGKNGAGAKWLGNVFHDDYKDGNQRLLKLTKEARPSQPAFIYTHLLMPHWPYLFDSTGRETGISFYTKGLPAAQKENAYIQYLAYTNKQMLQLVDTIAAQSNGGAAIILMSDHGYRQMSGTNGCEAVNNNFLAVYLPGTNYQLFYDSMSNVNLFRSVFNTLFRQQFERLPDKCIF